MAWNGNHNGDYFTTSCNGIGNGILNGNYAITEIVVKFLTEVML